MQVTRFCSILDGEKRQFPWGCGLSDGPLFTDSEAGAAVAQAVLELKM